MMCRRLSWHVAAGGRRSLPDLTASARGMSSEKPALTVVVPAYNEAATIEGVLEDLLQVAEQQHWEVIVVDDGSSDETSKILAALESRTPLAAVLFHVVRHGRNRGYGAALKSGIRRASAKRVASMDADGQHHAAQLLDLLTHADQNDMVVGQRRGILHSPLWRIPGKMVLGAMATFLLRRRIPDLNSGLRLFRTDIIRRYLHLCPDGFSFSTTSTLVLLDRGYEVHFVPIDVAARVGRSAVSVATGLRAVLLIIRLAMLLAPLRLFLPVGVASAAVGVVWAIPYLIDGRGLTTTALLLILNGLLIVLFGFLADQIAELRKERLEE